ERAGLRHRHAGPRWGGALLERGGGGHGGVPRRRDPRAQRGRALPARGRVRRVAGFAEDVTERRRAEDEQRLLLRVGQVMNASLDAGEALRPLATLAVERVADGCAVFLVERDRVRAVEITHRDPTKVELAFELMGAYPPDLETSPAYQAVRT